MKKYAYTPTLTILFERTEQQDITLPSGRIVTDDVPLPPVLLIVIDDTPMALLATDGGWDAMTAVEAEAAYDAAEEVKEAKRAPKL